MICGCGQEALGYGSWRIDELLTSWGQQVARTNRWRERRYGTGAHWARVICLDLTAFWRPCLQGKVSKHYNSAAQKALPAIVFSVMSIAGEIGAQRLPLVSAIIRCAPETTEAAFRQALLQQMAESDALDTVTVMDAGFGLKEMADNGVNCFVLRMAKNCTARRNQLPEQKRGRPAAYGTPIRPLARTHKQKRIPATTVADAAGEFLYQGRTIRYRAWHQLVTDETKVSSTNQTFSLFVFFDPLYTDPLLLATNLALAAEQIFLIYLDRAQWAPAVEHPPLAAKQMIGLHRQFVSADEAKYRLPELALLTGNILAHCAAQLPPMPTGFWDRHPRATPGRLRCLLGRALFPNLVEVDPRFRKKNSVSDHLPKGWFGQR